MKNHLPRPHPPINLKFVAFTVVAAGGVIAFFWALGAAIVNGYGTVDHSTAAQPSATPIASTVAPFDLATYLADPVKGALVANRCKACHTFEPGGASRTGPNLFGIVGAPLSHEAGFPYSTALTHYRTTHPTWTDANLHAFLENPRATVPGTRMIFLGITDPRERADLIAWLKTLKQ